MKRLLVAAAVGAMLAGPAYADVTIAANTSGKGMGASGEGQTVTYIKGAKMRTDQTVGGQVVTSIFDLSTQQMITFSSKKKEAEVYNLAQLSSEIQKNVGADPKVSMTANGQTRDILGKPCAGYDLSISVPMAMGGSDMQMDIALAGPVWIAKGAAGAADYEKFYAAAAEKGFFFGNPQQAKGAPAQAKSMTEMYRAMAKAGVPYAFEISIKFEGSGPMVGMMNRMGGMSMTSTVTNVSTDAIPDDKFAVPAGYTTKTK